jgi:hypothetical protein
MTAPIQFIVLKYKGKWSIKSRDLHRFFSMQREAIDVAIRLANESGKEGKPAVVLFQKSKTEFQKIWTYGESAYPPTKSDLGVLAQLMQPHKSKMPAAPASHDAPSAVARDQLEPTGSHGDEA